MAPSGDKGVTRGDGGVSPAIDSPAVDSPTVDSPTVDSPTVDSPAVDSPTVDSPAVDSVVEISEIKLHPPPARSEWIDRPQLRQRLNEASGSPLVLITAPAGYGKSTLVAQWLNSGRPDRVAWVTLDPADNDPTRFWVHLAAALDRLGPRGGENLVGFVARNSAAITTRVLPRIVAMLRTLDHRVVIVLDDCHVLRSTECRDQLDRLIDNLPENTHLVLVSRSDPGLRLSRRRVAGTLAEIRTHDLCFTAAETASVLSVEGVRLSEQALQTLVQQTEGWPAATYLAALSLVGRPDSDHFVTDLSGSDRFIADYLSEEVLDRQGAELRAFILRMSAFDRFNVALANHVLQTGSARRLVQDLERTNLFLIPLHGGWFRFHHLFATFARSALEIAQPGEIRELHRRGAQWFAAHGDPEETIRHTLAAGDFGQAASLLLAHWVRFFDAGRSATVIDWLDALRGTDADQSPAALIAGAWLSALTGNQPEMRRRLAVLESMTDDHPQPDGTRSPQSTPVLIGGLFGFDGPDRMLADARRATELENDSSTPWYAVARVSLGHAAFVIGDIGLARTMLTAAVRAPVAPLTVRRLAFGVLSLCEAEQGNRALSGRLADQAMALVTEHPAPQMPQTALAYTAYGAKLAAEQRWTEALAALAEGLQVRRPMPGLSPWPLIHHLTVMAVVSARLGDHAAADELLAEVEDLTPWDGASMEPTRARIAKARHLASRQMPELPRHGDPLTPRELEVLRRLQGTQTLREIASDLYVSHNTVKTITLSVYRKLGAHSRSEAVASFTRVISPDGG